MKVILVLVSLLLPWYCKMGKAQLIVEVRKYNQSISSPFSSLLGGDYAVVSNITNPQGFSNPFAWFMKTYANIPSDGISGILHYPNPRGACSDIEPPPYLLNTVNATWFAIVDYYPACILEKISALRNAGYKLMITYSYDNRDLDYYHGEEVEATEFPILILPEDYVHYLVTLNATSVNGDSLLVVFVSADPTTQTMIKAAIVLFFCFIILLLPIALCICFCACTYCDTRDIKSAMQSPQREHVVREFDPKVETNTTCTICTDEFSTGDSVEVLPCDHIFHSACIEQWLKQKRACPVCRSFINE